MTILVALLNIWTSFIWHYLNYITKWLSERERIEIVMVIKYVRSLMKFLRFRFVIIFFVRVPLMRSWHKASQPYSIRFGRLWCSAGCRVLGISVRLRIDRRAVPLLPLGREPRQGMGQGGRGEARSGRRRVRGAHTLIQTGSAACGGARISSSIGVQGRGRESQLRCRIYRPSGCLAAQTETRRNISSRLFQ